MDGFCWWPGPVGPFDVDLVCVVAAPPLAAEFPIHRVLKVVAIEYVNDSVYRVDAVVLVDIGRLVGELDGEAVLVWRALVV